MQKVSPDAGAFVKAVTVKTPPVVLAVMSVACPLKAVVVVPSSNVTIRPLNWSVAIADGDRELVTMLVVVLADPTVPNTIPLVDLLKLFAEVVLPAI